MTRERKYRKTPIEAFSIPSDGQTLDPRDWASVEPKAVWYGLPEYREYRHPTGGNYRRCRVEAFGSDEVSLGYIPLPERYADAWLQLCYTVVYWMSEWKAWVVELGKPARQPRQPARLVRDCANNSGTRFLQYLVIRRLIIEELLQHDMSKDGLDELPVFDEYLIRERFDWLWVDPNDVPDHKLEYLWLDPVHEMNQHIFTWKNSKLLIPQEMVAPPASPTHTWMWGVINHFDFQKSFDESFAKVLRFYSTKSLRHQAEDMPYRHDAQGLPEKWHECHEPAVRFLAAREDELFGHLPLGEPPIDPRLVERRPGESSSAAQQPSIRAEEGPAQSSSMEVDQATVLSAASEGHKGIVDNEQTRAIVAAFTQREGGISLPEAHRRLEITLGSRFDAQLWGQLFDRVDSAPGEEPLMSIEDAFRFYGAGGDSHAKSMQDYREIAKAFL